MHDPHDLGHARADRGGISWNSAMACAPIRSATASASLRATSPPRASCRMRRRAATGSPAKTPSLPRRLGRQPKFRERALRKARRAIISTPRRPRSSPGSTSIRRSTGSSGAAATGRTRARCCTQHGENFLGNYTYLDLYDLMSQVPSFPSDVWRLVETKTMEPLAFVDRAEVTDPEGTAFGYDVDEEMAKTLGRRRLQPGPSLHVSGAGDRPLPLFDHRISVMGGAYLPPVQPETTGIIASTSSHAATHPRMEILIEKGRVKEVKGGGLYGEGIRLMMNYPGTNEYTWPFQKKPGYWWLYEAGLGTNPKYFKHPAEVLEGNNLSERNVAGVIHWALGSEVSMGPDKVGAWARGERGVHVAARCAAAEGPRDAPAQSSADRAGAHPRSRPMGHADRARRPDRAAGHLRARARLALRQSRTTSCAAITSRRCRASMRRATTTTMRAIPGPTGRTGRESIEAGKYRVLQAVSCRVEMMRFPHALAPSRPRAGADR